jgi:hypothetical protein
MPLRSLLLPLAALLSFFLSIGLWFTGSPMAGLFVGLWVPSILTVGVFMQAPRMKYDALFGLAVAASFALSIGLWFSGSKDAGVFVGLWVPSILAAGVFFMNAVRSVAASNAPPAPSVAGSTNE